MRFLRTPLYLCGLLLLCLGQAPSPTSAPAPYRLVDLGTLGGEESYANDINEHGEIVGLGMYKEKMRAYLLKPVSQSRP